MACLQEMTFKFRPLLKGHSFASLPLQLGIILQYFSFNFKKQSTKWTKKHILFSDEYPLD